MKLNSWIFEPPHALISGTPYIYRCQTLKHRFVRVLLCQIVKGLKKSQTFPRFRKSIRECVYRSRKCISRVLFLFLFLYRQVYGHAYVFLLSVTSFMAFGDISGRQVCWGLFKESWFQGWTLCRYNI